MIANLLRRFVIFFITAGLIFFDSALAQQMFYHLLGSASPVANFTSASQTFNETDGVWVGWPDVLSSWSKRRQIILVGSSPSTLTNFPFLIKLDSTRITYADTKAGGADLRFTDASGTLLSYEIESWDSSGTSYVWVNIPSYTAEPDRTNLWMYYGNAAASDGQSVASVWDTNFKKVMHLSGTAGAIADSTVITPSVGNSATAYNGGSGMSYSSGLIGNAIDFDGVNDWVDLGNDASFNIANNAAFTFSAFVKTTDANGPIISLRSSTTGNPIITLPIGYSGGTSSSGKISPIIRNDAASLSSFFSNTINDNSWHLITLTRNAGSSITLFVDGVSAGTTTVAGSMTVNLRALGSERRWVQDAFTTADNSHLQGKIDEFQFSDVQRSSNWILSSYLSALDQLALFQPEQTPSTGLALVTVQLNQPATDTVIIPYTISGTATASVDHSRTSGSLTISRDSSSGSLNTYALRDNLVEGSETAIITLTTPATNASLGPDIVHTITITDEALFAPDAVDDIYTQTNFLAQTFSVLSNDSDANNDQLQITSVGTPTYGTAALSGKSGQSIIYTPSDDFAASDSFTYTISDGRGGTDTATVTINYQIPFTWIGAGTDANWTNTANWLGGAVPNSTQTGYFNNQCTTYCNPVQTANISIGGLRMNSSYAGTIAQVPTYTFAVGASIWRQRGGTFTGNNANVSSASGYYLSGGSFTAPTANFTVAGGDFTITSTSPTYNSNNGILILSCGYGLTCYITPQNYTFNNVRFAGYYSNFNLNGSTMTIASDLELGDTYGGSYISQQINNGTFNVTGNISVINSGYKGTAVITAVGNAAGQTVTGIAGKYLPGLTIAAGANNVTLNGNIGISRHFIVSSVGTLTTTGSSINLGCGYGDTCSILPGVHIYDNVLFNGNYTTFNLGGSTFNVDGALTVGDTYGSTYNNQPINSGTILVKGNFAVNNTGYTGTATISAIGSSDTTISMTVANNPRTPGSTVTLNKNAISNKVTATTNVSFFTTGQNLNLSTGTYDMAGFNLTVASLLTIGTNAKLICNGGTVTYGSISILGEVSCGPSLGITWTGLAGDTLWSTAGNWTNNTIPGATDIARFSSICGANCNVTVDTPVSVKGINMTSTYAGAISQDSTIAMTIGTSGWTQVAGTFVGSDAAISLSGPFALSGGSYTATSATTTVNGAVAFTISGAPTFTHNSGTFTFTSAAMAAHTVTPSTAVFNNVNFAGSQLTTTVSGTMTVDGTLGLDDIYSASGCVNTGTIAVKGNVSATNTGKQGTATVKLTGTTNQTVTGAATAFIPNFEVASTGGTVTYSGTLAFLGSNFTHTSGTVDATASSLIFTSSSALTHTVAPGAVVYNNVAFEGVNLTTTISGDMTVNGLLKLGDTASTLGYLNTGTITAQGHLETVSYGKTGTANLRIAGSADQTVTGVATGNIPNFRIISTGGTVSYVGSLLFSRNFNYSSGTVNPLSSTAIFNNGTNTTTLDPGVTSFNNVIFAGNSSSSHFNISGDMTVNAALTMGCTGIYCYADGGNILAYGDVTANNYGYVGTAVVKVIGSGNQLMTGTSPAVLPSVEIASTGGTVTQSGTLIMSRNYTHNVGTVNTGTSLLQFGYSSYYSSTSFSFQPGTVAYNAVSFLGQSNTFSLGAGTLTANGTLTFGDPSSSPGAVNSGTINAGGNIVFTSYGKSGSVDLNAVGATASTLTIGASSSKITSNINIAKNAGVTVTMSSDVPFNFAGQDLSLTSGNLDMAGFDLTINDVLTVASGSTLSCNGGDLLYSSLSNSGTISCPGFSTYPYNWTGGSGLDLNWNTAGNWSGGLVPTGTSVVVFDDAYCGATCNATMNTAVSIKGIELKSGYTNTLTQGAGITATFGTKGWKQYGGIFAGSDSAITLNGRMTLSGGTFNKGSGYLDVVPASGYIQTGGTFNGSTGNAHFSKLNMSAGIFTAPSGTLQLGHTYSYSNTDGFVVSGGTFNHGSGTVEFMNSYASSGNDRYMVIDVPAGGLTLNNLLVNFRDTTTPFANGYGEIATGDTLTVAGDLTLKNGRLMNATVLVNGNLDIQCSGGNYSTSDVCADGGSTLVQFNGGTSHTYAFASGALGPYINIPTGETVTPTGGTTLAHFGKFNLTGGTFTAPTGTMRVGNDYYYSYSDGFIVTGGTYNHSNGNVEFMNSYASNGADRYMLIDVPAGGFQFYDLTVSYRDTATPFNTGYGEITAGDTLTVLNNLTLTNGHLNGGTLDVYGNVNIQCAGGNEATSDVCASGGTTSLNLLGSAAQTVTHAAGALPPKGLWTLNKAGGSVAMTANLNLSGTNQDLTITAGTLNMAGYNLTVNRNITNNGTLQRGVSPGCGILTYGGSFSGTAAICP